MITVDVLHVSGIVIIILISASLITFTTKFILHRGEKLKKPSDLIYDPDHGANISAVCIFSKKLYSTAYKESPCHNKTLIQWYNPWLRHGLWITLQNEIRMRNRLKEARLSEMKVANNAEPEQVPEPAVLPKKVIPEVQRTKTEKMQFIYSVLVGLLTISMIFACWEVFKDRLKKNRVGAGKSQECTLADFNINRHRRRESQQQPQTTAHLSRQASSESTPKVTQTLFHQSSLDRAFPKTISEVVKCMEARRSSVPTCLDLDVQGSGRSQTSKMMKRQSFDVAGEEIGLDLRRKSRHLIRRH